MGLLQSRAEMRDASCGWIREASVAALPWRGTEAGLSLLGTQKQSSYCMNWVLLLQAGLQQLPPCLEMHCGGEEQWHRLTHGLCPFFWLAPAVQTSFE